MTPPVGQAVQSERWRITFTMPAGYTMETLPARLDSRLVLRQESGRMVAAIRYSGTWSQAGYSLNEKRLRLLILERRLEPVGDPVFARYTRLSRYGFCVAMRSLLRFNARNYRALLSLTELRRWGGPWRNVLCRESKPLQCAVGQWLFDRWGARKETLHRSTVFLRTLRPGKKDRMGGQSRIPGRQGPGDLRNGGIIGSWSLSISYLSRPVKHASKDAPTAANSSSGGKAIRQRP